MINPTKIERECQFGDPYCPCQDGDACHYVDLPGTPAMRPPAADHDAMKLWRECGLPEWFLGNGGTNYRLAEFYHRARAVEDGRDG